MENMKKYELEEDELTDDELDFAMAGYQNSLERLYNDLENPLYANNKEKLERIREEIRKFEAVSNSFRGNNESSIENKNR